MKKILLLAVASIAFASCSTKPTDYKISGVVDSTLNGQTIYLYDMQTNNKKDSAVITNGTFEFTGKADTAYVSILRVGRSATYAIVENGVITVDVDKQTANGTPINDSLTMFYTAISDMYKDISAQYKAISEDMTLNKEARGAKYDQINKTREPKALAIGEQLYNANTTNLLGAFVLTNMGLEDSLFTVYFEKGSDVVKNFAPNAKNANRIAGFENTSAGKPFADIDVINANGETVKLSSVIKGKYALLDFWASWCGPCRGEIPNLANIHKKYGKDVQVVGINVWDQPEDAKKTIEELKMNWTKVTGADKSDATDAYGIRGIPTIILISPEGIIIDRTIRGEQIEAKIKEVLKK